MATDIGLYVSIWLIFYISIVVHEAAHLVAMTVFGEGVRRMSLGAIRLITVYPFGIPVDIGLVPFIGTTLYKGDLIKVPWQKKLIFAAAGPASTFTLSLAAFALLGGMPLIGELAKHWFFAVEIVKGLAPHGPALPVLLTNLMTASESSNIKYLLYGVGILNLIMAILNSLPIPMLDGGQILFAVLESVFGKAVWTPYKILAPICYLLILIYAIVIPFLKK